MASFPNFLLVIALSVIFQVKDVGANSFNPNQTWFLETDKEIFDYTSENLLIGSDTLTKEIITINLQTGELEQLLPKTFKAPILTEDGTHAIYAVYKSETEYLLDSIWAVNRTTETATRLDISQLGQNYDLSEVEVWDSSFVILYGLQNFVSMNLSLQTTKITVQVWSTNGAIARLLPFSASSFGVVGHNQTFAYFRSLQSPPEIYRNLSFFGAPLSLNGELIFAVSNSIAALDVTKSALAVHEFSVPDDFSQQWRSHIVECSGLVIYNSSYLWKFDNNFNPLWAKKIILRNDTGNLTNISCGFKDELIFTVFQYASPSVIMSWNSELDPEIGHSTSLIEITDIEKPKMSTSLYPAKKLPPTGFKMAETEIEIGQEPNPVIRTTAGTVTTTLAVPAAPSTSERSNSGSQFLGEN
mmetsp:Transcript_34685/g.39296  ORF Transcript_34685/g.39296 Transcript_34685/m.39296 type:complete len:414 (-) Transcript_34685:91-1332(-)